MAPGRITRRGLLRRAAGGGLAAAAFVFGTRTGFPGMVMMDGPDDDPYAVLRRRMVEDQILRRGVKEARVLRAMRRVPRHLFVPESLRDRAHEDGPLPIGEGQTISQPYIVGFMTEALQVGPDDRVLDVGTGSGYQAAVLAEIVKEVFSIEILDRLAADAARRLADLGYRNVTVRAGDGWFGWPEKAPFDGILVAAAPGEVPPALIGQLKPGGRLVIPVGGTGLADAQHLIRITRTDEGTRRETLLPVRFVPMTGAAERTD
jgi:protein-L-isoaspartate(D-aspartate) O-methyltransferase